MNKKTLSKILLCLIILSFVFTIVIFVNTGITFHKLKAAEIDTSNEKLPGGSVLASAFVLIGLWIGSIFISGITSSIGFLCSLINIKIAENAIINRISKVSLFIHSAILFLIFSALVFFIISLF
ncbi:MAG: hypothetical protein E7586_05595 [Ruminococcaceae bacterium]|nr:hypothetical protein [Oscillospiraceae bacterium]